MQQMKNSMYVIIRVKLNNKILLTKQISYLFGPEVTETHDDTYPSIQFTMPSLVFSNLNSIVARGSTDGNAIK